jgi:integrase
MLALMLYKKGKFWMIKLKYRKGQIRKSTHTADKARARVIEGELRKQLYFNEAPKAVPTLKTFIENDYLSFVAKAYTLRPATRTYYVSGTKYLLSTRIAEIKLNAISSRDVTQLATEFTAFSMSTLNCALRTLRRILSLAKEWGIVAQVPPFHLAKGEKQRKRVLSPAEQEAYLGCCGPRWRDVVTIILGTGFRPGEVFALKWENIVLMEQSGFIHVEEGKSEAARRTLPMIPSVLAVIRERHALQGGPGEGWVFPARTTSGHANGGGSRRAHLNAVEKSGVLSFPPYVLRHTALTQLGTNGTDLFTLARIAGHSSIMITQRYVHPQDDAVMRAFGLKGGTKNEK